jgi:gamma-glutamylcyclotransferase (GGCT)/AIG2-like uncharacterized protein YtfP
MHISEMTGKREEDPALIADVEHCPYYFAYGMNTNTNSMDTRTGDHIEIATGILRGYELQFKVHCDVVKNPNNTVLGVLWEVTPRGLAKLDAREGYPHYYDRTVMWIQASDGQTLKAWVYYMNSANSDNNDYRLKAPNKRYWDHVCEGYREHGLSTQQLETARTSALEAEKTSGHH